MFKDGKTCVRLHKKQKFRELYLDYVNDFLTIGGFADYYGLGMKQAKQIIKKGRVRAKTCGFY